MTDPVVTPRIIYREIEPYMYYKPQLAICGCGGLLEYLDSFYLETERWTYRCYVHVDMEVATACSFTYQITKGAKP